MQTGAISFRPYIFNTNMLSSRSLSRISPIGDDLPAGRTDFSPLTEENTNTNPLRKGQSASFADIFAMQMQTGRLSASRLFKQEEEPQTEMLPEQVPAAQNMRFERNAFQMQRAIEAYEVNMFV